MSKLLSTYVKEDVVHTTVPKMCSALVCLFLTLMLPMYISAQTQRVTGQVKSESGDNLPGVTVTVKGTTTQVSTDAQGRFGMEAVKANATLVFKILGYDVKEVQFQKSPVNVVLVPAQNSLDEVVVVGYGTQKRADLTGSIASVNMKDFEKAPVSSFDQALSGRVSGVQVVSGDGQPGSNANIVIRGTGSITQDVSPLYVVDGFPLESSNANSINPADIESIDILKDASATAIYGARGANGVILITTKKGKTGKPMISYNGYGGIFNAPKKMELMNAYDFVSYINEINPVVVDSVYLKGGKTLEDYKSQSSVDFQDYVFRTGSNQNHDIALRGGTDATKYAISGNYNDQKGIVINSGFSRMQGRINLTQNVSPKLSAGITVNYAYSKSYGQPLSATNFYASSSVLYSVWGYRPLTPIDGPYADLDILEDFYDPINDISNNQDYRVNPYINLKNQDTRIMTTNTVLNGFVEYNFSKFLKLRASGGMTSNNVERNIFNNSKTQSGSKWSSAGPNGTLSYAPNTTWLNENVLTYSRKFNKSHNLTALVGNSVQGNKNSFRSLYASQIKDEALGIDAIDNVLPKNTIVVSRASEWSLASFFSRVNYDYQSKYLLTATVRADGSSKFASDNRWGYFPSASAAWRIDKEEFAKDIKHLSEAKLRAGYGTSGNNRVSDFAYSTVIGMNNVNYWYSSANASTDIGSVITTVGNEKLKWETSKQVDVGLDLGFFNQRLTFVADYYDRVTHDLLLNASLPHFMGITSQTGFKNIGSLRNRGLEFTVNAVPVKKNQFEWNTSFNISFNRNKILSMAEGQTSLLSGSGTFFNTTFSALSPYISVVGRSVGEMYGLVFDGIYQYEDFNAMGQGRYQLKPEVVGYGSNRAAAPGDIKYRDINGDNIIDAKDYTVIGRGLPIHTGGFTNNFIYKNFDLNVLLQWSYGNDVINANRYVFEGGVVTNLSLNQFASYNDRWTPTNPSNTNYRAGSFSTANYSSRVIEDGSYLKLRTVSLGYNFNKDFLTKKKLGALRVYGSAQNLLTLTNYTGMDPEVSTRGSNLTPGFDYTAYPHSFSVVFGANLSF